MYQADGQYVTSADGGWQAETPRPGPRGLPLQTLLDPYRAGLRGLDQRIHVFPRQTASEGFDRHAHPGVSDPLGGEREGQCVYAKPGVQTNGMITVSKGLIIAIQEAS